MLLTEKRERLRAEIERSRKELAKLEALPELDALTDGSIVALFVRHGRSDPYTYVAFLTGGRFYLTGRTSPNGVDADELGIWLTTSGRRLVGLMPVAVLETGVTEIDLGEALLATLGATSSTRRSTWNPFTDNPYGD